MPSMETAVRATTQTGRQVVTRYLWMALPLVGVLFLLPRLLLWAQMSLTFIAWPWQFDLAEGVNLDATVQLAQGRNIYARKGPDAFTSAPYTPLFYLLNVPFTWLFGPSFGFGRAISTLATLTAALLLCYMVWKVTSVWSAGVLAGALWLSVSPLIIWSPLYTQSTLAPALGFSGLVWTLRSTMATNKAGTTDKRNRQWPLFLGVLLFVLAFYSKQTALDAAAATMLWLIIGDPKRGARLSLSLMALIVIPFFGADLILQGGLWEKVIQDHALPWSTARGLYLLRRFWSEYWPLVLWAATYVIGGMALFIWYVRSQKSWGAVRAALATPWALAWLYLVFATASVLTRLGGDGINYNHLIDLVLPLCLLAGLSLGFLISYFRLHIGSILPQPQSSFKNQKSTIVRNALAAGGVALLAILMVSQLFAFTDPHTWYPGMWPATNMDELMNSRSQLVASTPGPILSDDAFLLLHNGRPDTYDDTFMLGSLASLRRCDESVFVQSIRDRRFSLMFLFDLDHWSSTAVQALRDNYSLKFRDQINTWAPMVSPASPQYNLVCNLSNARDSLALKGYSLAPGVASNGVARGQVLRATLYWQPTVQLTGDYASYLHLVDDKGQNMASQDNPHTGATKPTTKWQAGSVITDTGSIPIPAGLVPGAYRLVAGMYNVDPTTGTIQSLPAKCLNGEQYGDAVSLGSVQIK